MRYIIPIGFLCFLSIAFFNAPEKAVSIEQTGTVAKSLLVELQSVPKTSAKAYEVFDVETGDILLFHNVEESLPIASVTKLFTAAKIMELVDDEPFVITREDVETEGRSGKLEAGQEYSAHELLFPLLIESSNDAATALSRKFGEVSLAGHVLADASGLSADNKATVSELSAEVRALYKKIPHVFDVTTLKQYIGHHTGWVNNSPVYDMPGYKGGKHGYTHEANQTLVAIFTEESLDNRELGYVLLGSDDVRADTETLRKIIQDSVRIE
jgi:D-alanyl-D-alanine carboxypeptidase